MPHSRCLIYLLHHPISDAVYIGQSSRGLRRPQEHAKIGRREKHLPVKKWVVRLKDYGYKYKITVLEEHKNTDNLDDAERFYIDYFRALGFPLLNRYPYGSSVGRRCRYSYRQIAQRKSENKKDQQRRRALRARSYPGLHSRILLDVETIKTSGDV